MTTRITETIYIYANGQIVDSYLIPKPPKPRKEEKIPTVEDLQESEKNLVLFYENIINYEDTIFQITNEKIRNGAKNVYMLQMKAKVKIINYYYWNLPFNDITNLTYYAENKASKYEKKK